MLFVKQLNFHLTWMSCGALFVCCNSFFLLGGMKIVETFVTLDAGRIQAALLERQWTMTTLSRQADVSYSSIRAFLKGRRAKAHRLTLQKMALALRMDPAELTVSPVG